MRTRTGDKIQNKIVALAYGDTFSGKTTLGLEFAYFKREDGSPFRLCVIDCESGGVDDALNKLDDNGVDMRNIQVFYTQSLTDVSNILNKIKHNEDFYHYDDDGMETEEVMVDSEGNPIRFDAVVIDGTNILKMAQEQSLLNISKDRNRLKAEKAGLTGLEKRVKIDTADLETKDYKALNFKGQNLVLDLMAIDVHSYITCRDKAEKINMKDDNGKTTTIDTGRKVIDSFKGIDFNVKTVLHMFNDNGEIYTIVDKDRTGVHKKGEKIDNPTLLDWEEVLEKNKGVRKYTLDNGLNKAVKTDMKAYEKETMKSVEKTTVESVNSEEEVNKLRTEINNYVKSQTPPKRKELKASLENVGLPTKFSEVKDIETLTKIKNQLGM